MQAFQMEQIASLIARETPVRSGLLLHGALAEYGGSGFIMAGHGGVGKSAASRRLPEPWHSLSDDATLVVRDSGGRYWAHPWPTWSRFCGNGPGDLWPVEQAIPLRAIFFLARAPTARLEPISATQAAALVLESSVNHIGAKAQVTREGAPWAIRRDWISAAQALARAVPGYRLGLSLHGEFWREIERVLPTADASREGGEGTGDESRKAHERPVLSTLGSFLAESDQPSAMDGRLLVVYTGSSMSPTLSEPDLLEVESYGARQVQVGDVVCFKSPGTEHGVVHRVIGIGLAGIITKGDRNPTADAWVLHASQLMGRVVAAQRGSRRRQVAGGWHGLVVARGYALGLWVRRLVGQPPRRLYEYLVRLGPFDRLLPHSLRPRLVRYQARRRVVLRLVLAKRVVGYYDDMRGRWNIKSPLRLFVDEESLERLPPRVWQPGQLAGDDMQPDAPDRES